MLKSFGEPPDYCEDSAKEKIETAPDKHIYGLFVVCVIKSFKTDYSMTDHLTLLADSNCNVSKNDHHCISSCRNCNNFCEFDLTSVCRKSQDRALGIRARSLRYGYRNFERILQKVVFPDGIEVPAEHTSAEEFKNTYIRRSRPHADYESSFELVS